MPSAPSSSPSLTEYESALDMAQSLAKRITAHLSQAIAERGEASLAVSGGSTPRGLYAELAQVAIDWSRIFIVLVDERWVNPNEEGSNETFVRQSLICDQAAGARFVGLKTADPAPTQGLQEVENRLASVPYPFDAVILGMGEDGHTASWFPYAQGLKEATATHGTKVAAIEAIQSKVTGPLTQRITLTRSALSSAREIYLLLAGEDKKRAWNEAARPGPAEEMPIRFLLGDPNSPIQTHYVP